MKYYACESCGNLTTTVLLDVEPDKDGNSANPPGLLNINTGIYTPIASLYNKGLPYFIKYYYNNEDLKQ